MKIRIITSLLILFYFNSAVSQTWTSEKIDVAGGDYPSLSYSTNGDLRIFYVKTGATEKMYLKKRISGQNTFGSEIYVFNSKRTAGPHYAANGDIDLISVSGSNSVNILNSTDNGNTWTFEKSYGASGSTDPCYLPLYMTDDADSIRLVFGYMTYSAVFGSYPSVYTAKKKQGVWDASATEIIDSGIEGGMIAGVYENGNEVCIPNDKNTFYSSDNGNTYTALANADPIPDQLKASDMCIVNNRIYLLHNYSYGPIGNDQNITFTYSDDNGATWMNPQKSILKNGDIHFYTRFAVSGNNIVVAWLTDQNATGNLGYKKIWYMTSNDNGQSWGSMQTLASLGANEKILDNNNVMLDMAAYNGKISLTYAVKDSLTDSSHVYLREIDLSPVTGINKISNTAFSISPNPANEILTVKLNCSGKEGEIINYLGSVVERIVIRPGENNIDISRLAPGVYILEIENDGLIYREKFVKE